MTKKTNPFKDKKVEDLIKDLFEAREALRSLRFSGFASRGKDAHKKGVLKQNVARLLTELTKRKNETN